MPFQHWACSIDCAKALEIPARIEQIAAAQELDRQYEEYVHECQRKFNATNRNRSVLSCRNSPSGRKSSRVSGMQTEMTNFMLENNGSEPAEATSRGCECVIS